MLCVHATWPPLSPRKPPQTPARSSFLTAPSSRSPFIIWWPPPKPYLHTCVACVFGATDDLLAIFRGLQRHNIVWWLRYHTRRTRPVCNVLQLQIYYVLAIGNKQSWASNLAKFSVTKRITIPWSTFEAWNKGHTSPRIESDFWGLLIFQTKVSTWTTLEWMYKKRTKNRT